MYLNCNFPLLKANFRLEFAYNLERKAGLVPCMIFGVASIPGRALGFHCMLENGAQFARMPLHAFRVGKHEGDDTTPLLSDLEAWDALSYDVSCTQYAYLKNMACEYWVKDKGWVKAQYFATIDFAENPERLTTFSEMPDEHKCAHVLIREDGNIAAQPNNRIRWIDKAFITAPFVERPDFKVNTHVFESESAVSENSDAYFYRES
jgi:hypothetical protein